MTVTWQSKVGDLYEAITDDEAWEALPDAAAQLVGARSCVLHQMLEDHRIESRWSYLPKGLMADLARVHPDGRDVWVEAGLRTSVVGRAVAIDDVLPESEFLRSPLWNDVIRPHGDDTGRSMGITQLLDGAALLITFQRGFRAGPFGRADLGRLDAIAGEIKRIQRTRALFGARAVQVSRLEAMLSGEGVLAMLVRPGLVLSEASPDARKLLERRDGLALRFGIVQPTDPALATPLLTSVEATIRRDPGMHAAFVCPRPGSAPPWRLFVLPAPPTVGDACLLLLRGSEQAADRRRMWLSQQHGATSAEIAVAEALVAGKTPEEVAVTRGVSLHTVRTQIRRLLEKTDARRVSQFVTDLIRLG